MEVGAGKLADAIFSLVESGEDTMVLTAKEAHTLAKVVNAAWALAYRVREDYPEELIESAANYVMKLFGEED